MTAACPELAVRAEEEGRVVLQVEIDVDGRVTEAWVVESASPCLDEAVFAAVRRRRYRPARPHSRGLSHSSGDRISPVLPGG